MSLAGAHILVVEDDQRLAKLLEQELSHEGYRVMVVHSGTEALLEADSAKFQLIVLDLNLPDMDGLEVAERLRGRSDSSIMMLTARGDVASRVTGLYAGASDYLTKPFSIQEFLARVHVRLRETVPQEILRHGGLELDLKASRCTVNGKALSLTAREFKLLELLLGNPGRIFSKEDLENRLYSGEALPSSNTIEVFISNLRKKLTDAKLVGVIGTVRGMGYVLR